MRLAAGSLAHAPGHAAVAWQSPLLLQEFEAGQQGGKAGAEGGGGHAEEEGVQE